MNRIVRRAVLVVLMTGIYPGTGWAQADQRTRVRVRFSVTAAQYRWQYDAVEHREINARMEGFLARELTGKFGFLRFDSAGSAPYELHFALADQDPSVAQYRGEVVFKTSLSGVDTRHPPQTWGVFRGASQIRERVPPTPGELLSLLRSRIPRTPQQDQFLLRSFLQDIPIADAAAMIPSPGITGWVLPYLHEELCMSDRSQFSIENVVSSGSVNTMVRATATARSHLNVAIPPRMRARSIVAELVQPPPELVRGFRTPRVRPGAAYVTNYLQRQPCAEPRHAHRHRN